MNVYIKGAIAAVVVAAGLFGWYQWKEPNLPVNQTPVGFQLIKQMESQGVPEIALSKIDGTPVKLSDYRGKIVIVNFWASWCNPCVEEFPSMIKLMAQFNKDVVVFAVSEDDTREDMQAFMKAMGLPKPGFEIVWDEKKENMKAWGVEKVPETFLVGRDGKLIRKVLGIENWANEDAVSYFKLLAAKSDGKPEAPEAIAPADSGDGAVAAAGPEQAGAAGASATPAPEQKKPAAKKSAKKKSKKKKHH